MKKGLALLLAAVLCVAAFTGCGNSNAETKAADETVKLRVAASPTPHAEILNEAKALLADKGIELEVIEFTDYVQPNLVVDEGDIDANYFQHTPYLDSFNEEQGTALVSAGSIHYEPLGIYPGKSNDLANIPEGATIVVPNDTTNEARALLLLEAQGLISLKEDAGMTATIADIVENPLNLEIKELEAAQLSRTIHDVDIACINGNYAAEAGYSISDALAVESADSLAAQTYVNIIVVKEGKEDSEKTKALVDAILADEVRDYINTNYNGGVVPIF